MRYKHEFSECKNVRTGPFPPMPLVDKSVPFAKYIESRGLDFQLAQVNGWYGSSTAMDSYDRVVVPAFNRQGIPYWQARLLDDKYDAPRYQSPSVPRYDSIIITYPYIGSRISGEVVIVEGPFDALAMSELDYVSIALMGNNPPPIVWDHIWQRHDKDFAHLISDSDSVDATVKWQAQLAIRGIKSRVYLTYGGKDAASLPLSERRRIICWLV